MKMKVICSPANDKERASIFWISAWPASGPRAILEETLLYRPSRTVVKLAPQRPESHMLLPRVLYFQSMGTVGLLGIHHSMSCVNVLSGEPVKSSGLGQEGPKTTSLPSESAPSPSCGSRESSAMINAIRPQTRASVGLGLSSHRWHLRRAGLRLLQSPATLRAREASGPPCPQHTHSSPLKLRMAPIQHVEYSFRASRTSLSTPWILQGPSIFRVKNPSSA